MEKPKSYWDPTKITPLVWGHELPPPQPDEWLIEGIIPANYITILFADGGVGKSTLLLSLGVATAAGQDWLGLKTETSKVLYLDYELKEREYNRRVRAIARGCGLAEPPTDLAYGHGIGSLASDFMQRFLREVIEHEGIRLLLIDSLTMASFDTDTREAHTIVGVMNALKNIGCTVICADHMAKVTDANMTKPSPFGSVFKHNSAAATFHLTKNRQGTLLMKQEKANFGEQDEIPLTISRKYEHWNDLNRRVIRFERTDLHDPRTAGLEIMPGHKVLVLMRQVGRPLSEPMLEELMGGHMSLGSIQSALKWLKDQGHVVEMAKGTWGINDH